MWRERQGDWKSRRKKEIKRRVNGEEIGKLSNGITQIADMKGIIRDYTKCFHVRMLIIWLLDRWLLIQCTVRCLKENHAKPCYFIPKAF